MNQRQAIQQVTDVAVWAREAATDAEHGDVLNESWRAWTDLADAADDLAAMIERDTFRTSGG